MSISVLEEVPPPRRSPIPGVREAMERRRQQQGGRAYLVAGWAGAILFLAVVVALVVSLVAAASPTFAHSGIGFLWGGTWDPVHTVFGAGVFVVGTLITTVVALALAVPIGVGAAAFLAEMAPRRLAQPLGVLVDLLAAVPSIVVGLWGLLVLTPVFKDHVEPLLGRLPALDLLFRGQALGSSLLLAGVVLAVMILPTVVALSRTALSGVHDADREAAMALGATRWQVTRRAVIPGARAGIEAAVTLATGRALGESIAVALVVGNLFALPRSVGTALLSPGATLGSAIINTFAGATTVRERSAIIGLVVVLLAISAAVNLAGQLLLRRRRRREGP